jgi:hypothetical protein
MTSDSTTTGSSKQPTKLAENRADFIRRLFAVTVSVGFANQLIAMDWVRDTRWPAVGELPRVFFLFLGLFLVIQSWEGYFVELEKRSLETRGRFYVDAVIVFAYLVLLSVSNGTAAFLLVICIIFFLYIVWDFLTFREYYAQYGAINGRLATYGGGVARAICGASELRHKLSTLVAFLYFLVIYGIYLQIKSLHWSRYAIGLAVLLGLVGYRWDQDKRYNSLVILVPFFVAVLFLGYFKFYHR